MNELRTSQPHAPAFMVSFDAPPLSRMGLLHGYFFKDEIFWRLLSEIGDFLDETVVLLQNYAHVVVAEIQRESLL